MARMIPRKFGLCKGESGFLEIKKDGNALARSRGSPFARSPFPSLSPGNLPIYCHALNLPSGFLHPPKSRRASVPAIEKAKLAASRFALQALNRLPQLHQTGKGSFVAMLFHCIRLFALGLSIGFRFRLRFLLVNPNSAPIVFPVLVNRLRLPSALNSPNSAPISHSKPRFAFAMLVFRIIDYGNRRVPA